MDPHLENKFLGVEKAFISQYKEKVINMAGEVQNKDEFKAKVYESFVVEKEILLGYVHDIIHYSKYGNDKVNEKETVKIETDQDCFNVSSRV